MRPDRDMAILEDQLRRYVLEPLLSPGFAEAVKNAMNAFSDLATLVEAEECRRRRPRITDNLPNLHRRYRRRP